MKYQVSILNWNSKEEAKKSGKLGSDGFVWVDGSVSDLLSSLQSGHAVCPGERLKKNRKDDSVYIISYDVDDAAIDMEDFVTSCPLKPTLYYHTYSNGRTDGFRYRLIYCFDEPVPFAGMYNSLAGYINVPALDSRVANQLYFGTNTEVYSTGVTYTVSDLPFKPESGNVEQVKTAVFRDNSSSYKQFAGINPSLSLTDFLGVYKEEYCISWNVRTELNVPDDEPIVVYPDNYLEVPRCKDWDSLTKSKKTWRWKDGQRRHKKLYIAGIIVRRLNPAINDVEMLYWLCSELVRYYVYSDKWATVGDVMPVAANVMTADVDTVLTGWHHAKYGANKVYCVQHRMSARQVVNKYGQAYLKEIRYSEIDEWYDPDLKLQDNLTILKELGIKTSERDLKRYKESRGYTAKRKKSANPTPKLSL